MGVDICFMGKPEALQKELDRSAKELNELFEQNGLTLPAMRGEEEGEKEDSEADPALLSDPQIYDIVRFVVSDLHAEGKIDCPCGIGGYEIEIVRDGIRVYCAECGAECVFPITCVSAAMDFLHRDSITLLPKGGH